MRDGILSPDRYAKVVDDVIAELVWLRTEGKDAYRWAHSGLGFSSGEGVRGSGVADPTAREATGRDADRLAGVKADLEVVYKRLGGLRRLLESPRGDVVPDSGGGWVSGVERGQLLAAQRRRKARGQDYGEA